MKASWCGKSLLEGRHVGLVIGRDAFMREWKRQRLDPDLMPNPFVRPTVNASVSFVERGSVRYAIVALQAGHAERTLETVYALLVHEAVHIWQRWCLDAGEVAPGDEVEAYSIQRIALDLFGAYLHLLGNSHKETIARRVDALFPAMTQVKVA